MKHKKKMSSLSRIQKIIGTQVPAFVGGEGRR